MPVMPPHSVATTAITPSMTERRHTSPLPLAAKRAVTADNAAKPTPAATPAILNKRQTIASERERLKLI